LKVTIKLHQAKSHSIYATAGNHWERMHSFVLHVS